METLKLDFDGNILCEGTKTMKPEMEFYIE